MRVYIITIIGSCLTALHTVAELAPGLTEAELRLLLELTRRGLEAPDYTFRASSRDLSKSSKLARSNVQRALDTLAERSIILTREGTATKPSTIRLTFLDTIRMGGLTAGPPLALQQGHPGLTAGPPLALQQGHPGPTAGPPPIENTLFDLTPPPPSISIDPISNIFDRLQKAHPKNYDAARLAEATEWVHGYQLKFGRDPNAHRPDAKLIAQLLTIASWPQLQALLYDLMAERKQPGTSYGWYVAVALQRVHGFSPQRQQQQRAALKLHKGRATAAPASAPTQAAEDPDSQPFDGAALIADLAKRKAL